MNINKVALKLFSSLKSIKHIPFKPANLLFLPNVLSLPPQKKTLSQMVSTQINQICPQLQKAKGQFEESQKKVSTLYSYIKDEILREADPQLNEQFHQRVHYYFQKQGKKIRPLMIEMLSTNLSPGQGEELTKNIRKWEALIQIMHIASLAHDDIIDDSPSRRGQQSQHLRYGAKIAVFSGNYVISKASKTVSEFNSSRLYEIYAYAMESLAQGEIIQLFAKNQNVFTNNPEKKQKTFEQMIEKYMHKTYYKTAALMSNALVGIPTLLQISNVPNKIHLEEDCFRVGQHFGLAFQLVDDILDYISTAQEMGKEEMADLVQGNVTAPVYFTYFHTSNIPQKNDQVSLQLLQKRKKPKQQALKVKKWVHESVGIELTYLLAIQHIKEAMKILKRLEISEKECRAWEYLSYKLLTRRK